MKNENVKPAERSYSSLLQNELDSASNKTNGAEPLAELDYAEELKFKDAALNVYWQVNHLKGKPRKIIPSPKGRFYRTTSKRKIAEVHGKFFLIFNPKTKLQGKLYTKSLLEPLEHSIIYGFLSAKINEPAYKLIGKSLNYLIIRGSYTEFSVIFNVHTLNADVVRKLKLLSDLLKNLPINIISSFIYLDPTRSDYYLENERPNESVTFKKLFGPDNIFLKLDNKKYSYHPTSFSQINESMIPILLAEAKRILNPEKSQRFYDLYCGYGLFSLYFADQVSTTMGIEVEGESIHSAITNATFHVNKNRMKFISASISGSKLEQILPLPDQNEIFLLDPPRQGTESNVINIIAERHPLKVLHIFCGIEQIKKETDEWLKHGYAVKEIQPLDMFPGTPNLEILILLEPV